MLFLYDAKQIIMKKIFPILLLLMATFVSMAQTDTLRLSSDVWPPFTDTEENMPIAIDIVREALNRIEINSTYTITGFDEVIEGIESGKFDGSPAFWISEERQEDLFYSFAYLENQLILVGRKGADVSMTSLAELKDHKIGLVKGYAYDETINSDDFQIVYGENDQENLVSLISNEIDYMLVDALLMQYLLKYELNDVSTLLEFSRHSIINKTLHFALRKDFPNAEKTIALFNEEIKQMIADGSYNKILGLGCIRADIDGDGTPELILSGQQFGEEAPEIAYNVYQSEGDSLSKYYINNQYYASWDEVPQQYKGASFAIPEAAKPHNSGMTLRF